MANFWIYRNKLSQKSESLDDVVNGLWPMYVSKGDMIVQKYSDEERAYFEDLITTEHNVGEEDGNEDENDKGANNDEETGLDKKSKANDSDKEDLLDYDETSSGESIF